MHKFKVGDNVIICNIPEGHTHAFLNGEEAIITALPGSCKDYPANYGISCRDGRIEGSDPLYLKHKEPPKDTREIDRIVSWDDCAWKPKQLVTNE